MRYSVPIFIILIPLVTGCDQTGRAPVPKERSTPYIAADIPAFHADSAYGFIRAQVGFGPRVNNTEAHRKCGNYLVDKIREYTPEVVTQTGVVRAFDGTPLRFLNIIASFGPPGNNRILLGAHWDSRPFADHDPDRENFSKAIDGANDGASGVGVLLEIARQMNLKPPPIGVDILLFDAEDYGPPRELQTDQNPGEFWGLGSQYWANNPHQPGYFAKYGILLDMVGAADATFLLEGVSMEYAPSVMKKVWDIANQIGYSSYFLYQRGGYITDDHYYVNRDYGIPMIDIIHQDPTTGTGMYKYWHTIGDNLSRIEPTTLKAVGQTVLTVIYSER